MFVYNGFSFASARHHKVECPFLGGSFKLTFRDHMGDVDLDPNRYKLKPHTDDEYIWEEFDLEKQEKFLGFKTVPAENEGSFILECLQSWNKVKSYTFEDYQKATILVPLTVHFCRIKNIGTSKEEAYCD